MKANERQRVSHANGAGPGAPASERVGESEGQRPSEKNEQGRFIVTFYFNETPPGGGGSP
jgi:hypothetical protein